MLEEKIMPESSGKFIDQMMAALAKKNLKNREMDAHRDPATGEIKKSKPRRGTGRIAPNSAGKRISGRGR